MREGVFEVQRFVHKSYLLLQLPCTWGGKHFSLIMNPSMSSLHLADSSGSILECAESEGWTLGKDQPSRHKQYIMFK